jgi:pimeloyl-ACP methyl ester carboxylesterase
MRALLLAICCCGVDKAVLSEGDCQSLDAVNEADVFPQPLHAQNIFHSVQNFIRDTAARVPGVVNTEPSAPEPSAPATAGPSAFEDAWALFQHGVLGQSIPSMSDGDTDDDADFEDAVPLDELQERCQPRLLGSEKATKLAILLHGFTSCPGAWYKSEKGGSDMLLAELEHAGYRIVLPLLPGHGRRYRTKAEAADLEEMAEARRSGDFSRGSLVSGGRTSRRDKETPSANTIVDDLSALPTTKAPYQRFAYEIAELAKAWRRDHPETEVVLAGHSLGGAVAAKAAVDSPRVFNRVLLLNPMFKPVYAWAIHGLPLPNFRFNMDPPGVSAGTCVRERYGGPPGYCSAEFKHVVAAAQFADSFFCHEWHLGCNHKKTGKEPSHDVLGAAHLRIVSSHRDEAIDNTRIVKFAKFVDYSSNHRTSTRAATTGESLCWLPDEMGHNYLHPVGRVEWWYPPMMDFISEYLAYGTWSPPIDGEQRCFGTALA